VINARKENGNNQNIKIKCGKDTAQQRFAKRVRKKEPLEERGATQGRGFERVTDSVDEQKAPGACARRGGQEERVSPIPKKKGWLIGKKSLLASGTNLKNQEGA